jgi:hypothetical protein
MTVVLFAEGTARVLSFKEAVGCTTARDELMFPQDAPEGRRVACGGVLSSMPARACARMVPDTAKGSAAMSEWGRVTDDGTVYVKTADGERVVGSWHAGPPEQGLAHFARRYEQLATEVTILEARLRSGNGDPAQVATSAERLKEGLPTAAAVGDLDALGRRVDAHRPSRSTSSRGPPRGRGRCPS